MVTAGGYRHGVRVKGQPTRYGRDAVRLLGEQVAAAKGDDALAPVTVVVASNYAAVAARRALAGRPGGVANVSFLTLHRLAEQLGRSSLGAAGRLPVSAPVLAAAVRSVLDEDPGVFRPVADHPATESALVAAHRELAACPDEALSAVATSSRRAGDVVRVHRSVRQRLAGGWYDEHDLLAAATAALEEGRAPELGPVIVHLLHELSAAGAAFLGALSPAHVNVGITGDTDADAPVLAAMARAGIDVPGDHGIEPACGTAIVSASDPDDEVRAAVRLLTRWMGDGVNLGRVAVLYATPEPYARLVHEQMAAAGIQHNGNPVRDVGDLLLGRTLRALLALPDRGYRRTDVLGVLTGAPMLDGDRRVPGRAWERVSREAGVVGGSDWDHRLTTLAERQRAEADAIDPDGEQGWRTGRLLRDAEQAEALLRFVNRLRSDLDGGANAASWADLVEWAHRLLSTYVGGDRHRLRWPEEERLAGERVEAALDRLAGLDALPGPPPTIHVFRRALESELEMAIRRVGRLGEGVLVGHLSVASGLVLDRVIVLGMAEGVFPPKRLEDSLLPDAERALAGGELALRAQRVHDDRRQLLAALDAAEQAVLCQPRGDLRRSGERPASRWLVADAARLAGVGSLTSDDLARQRHHPWFDHVASYAGGLAHLAEPASEQELRLAAVARGILDHPALVADEALTAALEVVRARRGTGFTRFDGNLASVANEIGRPPRSSASRLQTWAKCPHQYLLQHVLRIEPVEEPERLLQISAIDRGSLIHEILDEFVSEAIESGHPFDEWGPADEARLLLIAERRFGEYEAQGRTGRALFWRRDRTQIENDLKAFLDHDSRRLREGYEPLRTEHRFSELPVPLPSGHVLAVGGSIDRIDLAPDGSLTVLDYKTGSANAYRGLSADSPHGNGTHLQLYLYAVAAQAEFATDRPVHSAYWFNTAKGDFRCEGYDVTPEVAETVAGAIDTIVEGIAAGVFPAHPVEASSRMSWVDCYYCTPDGLSGSDRRREWERKRTDPALAGYLALAEPEVLDGAR